MSTQILAHRPHKGPLASLVPSALVGSDRGPCSAPDVTSGCICDAQGSPSPSSEPYALSIALVAGCVLLVLDPPNHEGLITPARVALILLPFPMSRLLLRGLLLPTLLDPVLWMIPAEMHAVQLHPNLPHADLLHPHILNRTPPRGLLLPTLPYHYLSLHSMFSASPNTKHRHSTQHSSHIFLPIC